MNNHIDIMGFLLGVLILIHDQPISFIVGVIVGFCFLCIPYIINKWRHLWQKYKKKKQK